MRTSCSIAPESQPRLLAEDQLFFAHFRWRDPAQWTLLRASATRGITQPRGTTFAPQTLLGGAEGTGADHYVAVVELVLLQDLPAHFFASVRPANLPRPKQFTNTGEKDW